MKRQFIRNSFVMTFLSVVLLCFFSQSEVIASTNTFSNEYLEYTIDESTGRFTIGTTGGNPEISTDSLKRMLFGHPGGSTSYTTIRINGNDYVFTATSSSTNMGQLTHTSEAIINGVKVQQIIKIIRNNSTEREDTVEIKYVATNHSNQIQNLGLRIMLDTMLGDNDYAPFRVPGIGGVTTETELLGDSIPEYWQAFDSLNNSTVVAQGTLFKSNQIKPDKVQFANWSYLSGNRWASSIRAGSANGDSAVAIYWNPREINVGESLEFITYYGLSEFTQDTRPPLSVTLTGATNVEMTEEGYNPNPFTVTSYIENIGNGSAENVSIKLNLPEGLKLVAGQEDTINFNTIGVGDIEQVSWEVEVEPTQQARNLSYSVDVSGSNVETKTVSRNIRIPDSCVINDLTMSPGNIIGKPGQSYQLNVNALTSCNDELLDVTSSDTGISYSSSNPQRVSVNSEGLVSVSPNTTSGTYYIRAYYSDKVAVTSLQIEEESIAQLITDEIPSEIQRNEIYQISGIKIINGDGTSRELTPNDVIFSSSNPDILTVTSEGVIQSVPDVNEGSSIIEISYGEMVIRTEISIAEGPYPIELLVDGIPNELTQGASFVIPGAEIIWSDGKKTDVLSSDIEVTSSRLDRIGVEENKIIASDSILGLSYITITYDGLQTRYAVRVISGPTIVSFRHAEIPTELEQGESHTISGFEAVWSDGSVTPVDASEVTITSSRPDRVSVSGTELTGEGVIGLSYIKVEYKGISKTSSVRVPEEATLVDFRHAAIPGELKTGETHTISGFEAVWSDGSVTPVDASEVTITSSRPDRVSVSGTELTGEGVIGLSYIKVEYKGISKTSSVRVPEEATLVEFRHAAIPGELKTGETHTISGFEAVWSDGSVTLVDASEVTITSSRPDRVSVSGADLTGEGVIGLSYIKAEYKGISKTSSVRVPEEATLVDFRHAAIPGELKTGETHTISGFEAVWSDGSVTPVDASEVTITSSRPDRVSVSGADLTGEGVIGLSYIKAEYKGISKTSSVRVPEEATLVEFRHAAIPGELKTGETHTISGFEAVWSDGSVTPVDASEVTITSSRPDRVSVSGADLTGEGVIGLSYIKAEYKGISKTSSIRVPEEATLVEFRHAAIPGELKTGETHTISGFEAVWSDGSVTPVDASEVTITSSRPDRVSVSGTELTGEEVIGLSYIKVEYKGIRKTSSTRVIENN